MSALLLLGSQRFLYKVAAAHNCSTFRTTFVFMVTVAVLVSAITFSRWPQINTPGFLVFISLANSLTFASATLCHIQALKYIPADVRNLNLEPRCFRTNFGGLFLFMPYLTRLPFDRIMKQAQLPGSVQAPASHAIRSLLTLKLYGNARSSHVMSDVLDDGPALFVGLNRIPKRTLTVLTSSTWMPCHQL
ncbi:MAG: hypothetical protein KGY41_03600 [Desulfovermiculus sp.]|nr:hypothetical protein [Desulfovermiculus sp.]